jgi:hypothetical protein
MSISKPIALDSHALANTAIINKQIDTVVGVWDLSSASEHAPESTFSFNYKVEGEPEESVCGDDERVKVSPSDFAEGGKYRCKSP